MSARDMSASGVRPARVSARGVSTGRVSLGNAMTVASAAKGRDRTRAGSLVRQGGAS